MVLNMFYSTTNLGSHVFNGIQHVLSDRPYLFGVGKTISVEMWLPWKLEQSLWSAETGCGLMGWGILRRITNTKNSLLSFVFAQFGPSRYAHIPYPAIPSVELYLHRLRKSSMALCDMCSSLDKGTSFYPIPNVRKDVIESKSPCSSRKTVNTVISTTFLSSFPLVPLSWSRQGAFTITVFITKVSSSTVAS